MEFLEEFKDRISKEFVLGYNLKIGLEFQIIDKNENDSIFNINCLYRIYSSNLDNNIFKEENILLNKTNSKAQGFVYLINEINGNNFDHIKFQEISEKETNKASVNNNNNDPDETKIIDLNDITKEKEYNNFELEKRASNYQILDIIGILGKFNENTDVFIKELSNGWYIIGEGDNILEIYDQDFEKKEKLPNNSINIDNLFNSNQIKLPVIVSGKSYLGSIKINESFIAITSNKVQYNGEDKLIFYNTDKNKISKEIEGYSFTSGIYGLALMPRKEVNCKNRLLLCACKKYIDNQKNGIYLANPQLEDKQGINNPFYDTGNFEVFCFCPILIVNPDNSLLEKRKEKEIIDTDYFFVGGFNLDKREGEIKLFKVIYSEKASDNKIEFVKDIEFERNKEFTGFEGAISYIMQTKIESNGYILISCYNGKVYLLTMPNLDYYLNTKI